MNLPVILLTNANRVISKLDELYLLTCIRNIDIIAITESWLDGNIPNSLLSLPNYSIVRLDRENMMGGGVMFFIRSNMAFYRILDLPVNNSQFEICWVLIRPKLLPRAISVLILAVVYSPPWYDVSTNHNLCTFIVSCVDHLKRRYPGAGFVVMGDFNQLDTQLFNKHICFKQIVNFPTRGSNILDKVFTNVAHYYPCPVRLPPLGRSDHSCVLVGGDSVHIGCAGYRTVRRRRVSEHSLSQVGIKLLSINWSYMYKLSSCQQQADFFYGVVEDIFNDYMPLVTVKVKNNQKPWISEYFKKLINSRNKAWRNGDLMLFKKLRNRANRCRLSLRKQYYLDEVETLKKSNSRDWWRHIKSLGGITVDRNTNQYFDNVICDNMTVDINSFPDVFNNFMSSLIELVKPLDCNVLPFLRNSLDFVPDSLIIDEWSVFNVLNRLKVDKSSSDLVLNNRMLRQFSDVLAGPVCALINTSIRQGYVPTQWKIARVVPIPKVIPPVYVKSDFRPISITTSVSKVAEHFLCNLFEEHFKLFLDDNQFGSTSKRSTTHALIGFSHFLFSESDKQHNILRVLFVDFAKAFDLVDSNVLFRKFSELSFPKHVTTWFLSFLYNRRRYVEVGNISSSVVNVHAGTPQGTISGPNVFRLLINDLQFDLPYIKYVDDTTVASSSVDHLDNALQSTVDRLRLWCSNNGMFINVPKTKEMVIYFGNFVNENSIPGLFMGSERVERVTTFKLLGVVFSRDLSWHSHVSYILEKVSKRLFIIWQLVRSGVSFGDIIIVYCTIIRSILEYACPVWHCGLAVGMSADIERVQKRVLRIILPDLHYKEALVKTGLERLDTRRERITRETFQTIKEPNHVLHNLLPTREIVRVTRDSYPYFLNKYKTSRFCKSFINYCVWKKY